MKLNERVLEGELMDAPDLAADLHYSALRGLQRVNRLSGIAQILAQPIVSAFLHQPPAVRILDLACGGGDVTIRLAELLHRRGIQAQIQGWDRSQTAVDFATARLEQAPAQLSDMVTFHQRDMSQLDDADQYDVVMCTLFLHHLDRPTAIELLSRMFRASRGLVIVDDLRRTWLGYRLAQLGCQLLTRSRIVHVDGPLSVRAAFTEAEVIQISREAGLPDPSIARHWPQRFLAQWHKDDKP